MKGAINTAKVLVDSQVGIESCLVGGGGATVGCAGQMREGNCECGGRGEGIRYLRMGVLGSSLLHVFYRQPRY